MLFEIMRVTCGWKLLVLIGTTGRTLCCQNLGQKPSLAVEDHTNHIPDSGEYLVLSYVVRTSGILHDIACWMPQERLSLMESVYCAPSLSKWAWCLTSTVITWLAFWPLTTLPTIFCNLSGNASQPHIHQPLYSPVMCSCFCLRCLYQPQFPSLPISITRSHFLLIIPSRDRGSHAPRDPWIQGHISHKQWSILKSQALSYDAPNTTVNCGWSQHIEEPKNPRPKATKTTKNNSHGNSQDNSAPPRPSHIQDAQPIHSWRSSDLYHWCSSLSENMQLLS